MTRYQQILAGGALLTAIGIGFNVTVSALDTRIETVANSLLSHSFKQHQAWDLENRIFELELKPVKSDSDTALINRYKRQKAALLQ